MSQSQIEYPKIKPLGITRHGRIAATGKGMPERVVTNRDIIDRYDLIASDRAVQFSLGAEERRWGEETVSELMLKAANECFQKSGITPDKLDRIIYTKLVGENSFPGTSVKFLEKLGLNRGIPAMDISAACSGMIHAMDMALRFIDSGEDYILVFAGDSPSMPLEFNINPDTRTIFLNGDGVAAVLLEKSDTEHFLASYIYTDNNFFDYSYMPYGTELLNKSEYKIDHELLRMNMPDGKLIHEGVLYSGNFVVTELLRECDMAVEDIDIFVTCDQTTHIWKDQCKALGIPEEKSISLFYKYGNTVAAMTPLNLDAIIEDGRLKRGMTVLMVAHGAGASGGGFIFRY